MNRNSLYDEKVRQQLGGVSTAVGDYRKKIEMLVDEDKKAAKEIPTRGFKGELLDLEVEVYQPQQIIEDGNKLIEEMLENNVMNLTGQLFKLGVQVVNTGVTNRAKVD